MILYLGGNDEYTVGLELQRHFVGKFHIVPLKIDSDMDRFRMMINECIAAEHPQIIVVTGENSYLALFYDWPDELEVVVVNPFFGRSSDEIPCWRHPNVFILCTAIDKLYRESVIPRIKENCDGIRVIESHFLGSELNGQGQEQLFKLLDTVARYHELGNKLLTSQEFEDMVRNRPKPDMPGYYSLKVWSYDKSWQWKDLNDEPGYRRPVSSRQIEFATKEEALESMLGIAASGRSDLCAFFIERLPFGIKGVKPMWLEAWSYDANGNLIQEASCSAAHQDTRGIYGKFFGHLPESLKWHRGHIVQFLNHTHFDQETYSTLGVIVDGPDETNEVYKDYLYVVRKFIRDGKHPDDWLDTTAFGGANDDEIFIQFGPYSPNWTNLDYCNTMMVLPAPEDLPDEVKAELRSWHADWLRHIGEERDE